MMKYVLTSLVSIALTVTLSHAGTESIERSELIRDKFTNKRLVKSGTPELLRLLSEDTAEGRAFKTAYINAGRSSKDMYADSEQGHFRVHYDTTGVDAPDMEDLDRNGIPDFVDSTLVYLEHAWDKIIALGYGTPRSDKLLGGSGAVDCYLEDLGNQGMFGYTQPDNGNGVAGMISSSITIDNNFTDTIYYTTGYDAVRVATAHEFFHVIHMSYYSGNDATWWMEQTAVWFENHVWDEVNDYLYYLYTIFDDRNLPIDTHNSTYEYGAAMFAFYIVETHGIDTIRLIWNALKDNQSGKIEHLDPILPGGLAQNLSDFSVWLYFTGERANTQDFFSESDIVTNEVSPEKIVHAVPASDTIGYKQYTFKYVEIVPDKGLAARDTLKIDFTDFDGGLWKNQVILYNSPGDYAVQQINWQQPSIITEKAFEKAVLVTTNASERPKTFSYAYAAKIVSSLSVDDIPDPEPFVLHPNYPNPFNPSTTVSYSLPEESPVLLRVINMQGQVIRTLRDGISEAGSHSLLFDGSGLPSGIYFVQLTAGDIRLSQKITLMK